MQAFFNRISDPRFGGTYLTLLTTLKGLGYFGSSTVALRMVNILTFAKCSVDTQNSCSTPDLSNVRIIDLTFFRVQKRFCWVRCSWNKQLRFVFKTINVIVHIRRFICLVVQSKRWRLYHNFGRILRRSCSVFGYRTRLVRYF